MSKVRRGRHWLVLLLGVLLCAGAVGVFAERDGEDSSPASSSDRPPTWPADLAEGCADAATGPAGSFYAAKPLLGGRARSAHHSAVVLLARDQKHYATCLGRLESEVSFETTVRPLRDYPRGTARTPLQVMTTTAAEGPTWTSLVLATRLPAGVTRVLLWTEDGRKIPLLPQGGRWISAVVDVPEGGLQGQVFPARRMRYMSATNEVIAEWAREGVRPAKRFPRIQAFAMLDAG